MRISTSTIYEQGVARINDLQSGMAKTQQQLSTGRRVLTPADDPVAAARALEITQSQAVNRQFAANRQAAVDSLNLVESTLTGVTSLLQDARVITVNAGNASLTDQERGYLATELRGRFEELLGLANATDSTGNSLFSGYQVATKPFVQTPTGVQYVADQGQRLLQVDSARQMAISDSGQQVFQGGNQDIFKTLSDLITVLETPATASLSAGLATALDGIDQGLDNILTVRASVGSRLKELDALESAGQDRNLQYSQTLSQLQDLDYAQAITQLSQQQVTLEAAQKSFLKTSGLSLFNFL